MHFLKCNHCGNFNEVKSEYLTFCQYCDKKLDNHFRHWSERNPGKTFDDYKKEVCLTEADRKNQSQIKEPKPRKSLKYWIGFTIVAIISALMSQFFSGNLTWLFIQNRTSDSLLEKTWVKQTIGNDGLSLETPFKLDPISMPMQEEVTQIIDNISSYTKETKAALYVLANAIKYIPEVGEISIEGSAYGAIEEMKKLAGVSQLEFSEEQTTRDGIPGIIQSGTFKQKGMKLKFYNNIYGEKLTLYQVLIVHQVNDKAGDEIAQRIMESISIAPGIK